MNKPFKTHVFTFNPQDNGGESLTLKTLFFKNEDGDFFTNQYLTLQSYNNSVTVELITTGFNPSNLRELANQLDSELNKKRK